MITELAVNFDTPGPTLIKARDLVSSGQTLLTNRTVLCLESGKQNLGRDDGIRAEGQAALS